MNAEQHGGGGGEGGRTEGDEKRMTGGRFGLIAYLILFLFSLSSSPHLLQQMRKLPPTDASDAEMLSFYLLEKELRLYGDSLTAMVIDSALLALLGRPRVLVCAEEGSKVRLRSDRDKRAKIKSLTHRKSRVMFI